PDFRALVSIAHSSIASCEAIPVSFAAKLNIDDWNMKLAEAIDHAASHSATIDKYCVCTILRIDFTHLSRECHCVDTPEKERRKRSAISTFSEVDNARVVTKSSNINSDDDWLINKSVQFPFLSFVGKIVLDELHGASAWEYTSNAHADKVVIFSIVGHPSVELFLVCEGDRTRIDRARVPNVGELTAWEALAEPALWQVGI